MTAQLIDGNALSRQLRTEVAERAQGLIALILIAISACSTGATGHFDLYF